MAILASLRPLGADPATSPLSAETVIAMQCDHPIPARHLMFGKYFSTHMSTCVEWA